MHNVTSQKGSIKPLAIILAVFVVAGLVYYVSSKKTMAPTSENSNSAPITIDEIMNAKLPDITQDAPQAGSFTLVEGKFTGDVSGSSYDVALKTASSTFAYGDLNGEGASDMVATIDVNTGGTGVFTYLLFFLNKNGKPLYTDSKLLGDRIKVTKVSIANNFITANIITQGPGEPMCCGTMPKRVSYDLVSYTPTNSKLVEVDQTPMLFSISPSSAALTDGLTIQITGVYLSGFEGDKNVWIENAAGQKGIAYGTTDSTDNTIKFILSRKLCTTDNSYSGKACSSWMTIVPGTYSVYVMPWGVKSSPARLIITN